MYIAIVVAKIGSMRPMAEDIKHPAYGHCRERSTDNGDGDCPGIYMFDHIRSFPASK
jgi:hypothetical protein